MLGLAGWIPNVGSGGSILKCRVEPAGIAKAGFGAQVADYTFCPRGSQIRVSASELRICGSDLQVANVVLGNP